MTYEETTAWMFRQLPMYQQQGGAKYKIDLSKTERLVKHLSNPHTKFKSIHVAGTNGKGSTSHMLASILQEAGYKVGLYTSPHLKDFRERIKINGLKVSEDFVVDFVGQHRAHFESQQYSFFEMTVGMAFSYFASERVDVAVVEVGLGGRLDSTNVLTPEVSVITNIGFDHVAFLGNTYAAIAVEKAGIIKEKVPVVIGETEPETKAVFEAIAKERSSPIIFAEDTKRSWLESDLRGTYQKLNQRTVREVISLLRKEGWVILEDAEKKGLKKVNSNTGLLGRWQVLGTEPKVICDTGHNKEGITLLMKQIKKEEFEQLHIVLGMVKDKNLDEILPLFPKTARYYFTQPTLERALDAVTLKEKAEKEGLKGRIYATVREAYGAARDVAKKEDLIFIGGSTFVVAEVV